MNTNHIQKTFPTGVALIALLGALLAPTGARAAIDGVQSTTLDLTAGEGFVTAGDGASIYTWLFNGQYPGPTLIVDEGQTVTITVQNSLPAGAGNVSLVVPGFDAQDSGGVAGLIAQEAEPGGAPVAYTFTADRPGTFMYHSATRPELQLEMGLFGAIVVRPTGTADDLHHAYDHPGSYFDREYLFLLSEMSLRIHQEVEQQLRRDPQAPLVVATEPYQAVYWFINGRTAPDLLVETAPGLASQPYDALPMMHPGEKLLSRLVNAGRTPHPWHPHGNHTTVLARDGELLVSALDSTTLVGRPEFTITMFPGQTVDGLFDWTGEGLGWDAYGHRAGDAVPCTAGADGYNDFDTYGGVRYEWCADHEKPIPVQLPEGLSLAWGGFYSGSPYLGTLGSLPPGEGGLNPWAGFTFPWHSHAEKEIVNNDLFPGGMITFVFIVPYPEQCPEPGLCDLDGLGF